ncbi:MAG TPA: TonB-dependent receptor [Steroidobacteraceae bacterium]|nr:TonB-dependent receptor [Steroidobacteraceae bacterium]
MRIHRSTLVGTAVAIALFGQNNPARAADDPNAKPNDVLEEVVVSGIRYSEQQSLEAKRNSDSHVEVITAEDIGKMPDKNVADSLARVTGVTTSSASANEGGFDENDRISMRGTNPSLTQTLINGHNVASGDWFVLNQIQQVGRSVSYTLLPSELVNTIVVRKSSEASLVEGGVAGSVDIITRRPLDLKENVTFTASVGLVYAELPDKTDPQLSALFGWKNDASNFGVIVQAFDEKRHLRRDGVELLGYEQFAPTSVVVQGYAPGGLAAHPDLSGVYYPALVGAALFEQERERKGGLVDVQFKANDNLSFDGQFFYSKLDAGNYNRNYLLWQTHFVNKGGQFDAGGVPIAGFQAPDPGYTITNGTLTQANFSPVAGTLYGVYDQISRPDESGDSNFGSLEAAWRASDALTFNMQLGTSTGHGKTPTQNVSETQPGTGMGAGWTLNGVGNAPDFNLGATNNEAPVQPGGAPITFGWIFGAQYIDVKDQEDWARIDSNFQVDHGAWTDLKFGVRWNKHERDSQNAIAQGPTFGGGTTGGGGVDTAHYPTSFINYPSNFNTFGGNFPSDVWYWTPSQLAAYNLWTGTTATSDVQRDAIQRMYYQYWFGVKEDNTAAYAQFDFKGSNWSGNIGLRYVQTKEDATTYTASTTANNPDAITGSLFGPFVAIPVSHTYNDFLPSANLKVDLSKDLVARFAVSKTMTRADYSALAGFTDLTPPSTVNGTGTGTGGNPDLKPIRSTNVDAALEWYFAKNSLLAGSVFYMDLENYVSFGSETKNYFTFSTLFPTGADVPYLLTVPVNAKGRVQGFELTYKQAFLENFGIDANYTYADGKQTSLVTNGDDRLVGTSKNTYNLSGYYENAHFNARVTYTYRSAFFSGLDRNSAFSQDDIASLAASLGYTLNDHLSFTLDGQNLTNETLKYYSLNKDQPRAFYKNGAQYYFNVRFKF